VKLFRLSKKLLIWLINIIRIKHDPVKYARKLGVKIGADARLVSIHGGTFGSEPYLITLGDHVTVAGNVQFVTHDGGVWVFRKSEPEIDVFGRISIGNNVFIGYGSIIMPGVNVGDNVVIGAGSIVSKDIPSNSVAAGVPAKVLKSIEEYKTQVDRNKTNVKGMDADDKKEVVLKLLGVEENE